MTIDVRGLLLRMVPAFMIGLMASVMIFDKWSRYSPQTQTQATSLPSLPTISSNLVVRESYSRRRREPEIPPPFVSFVSTTRTFTNDVVLMILIFSEPGSGSLRNTVRGTWLNWVKRSPGKTSYMFIVGVSGLTQAQVTILETENNEDKDMVLVPTSSLKPYNSQLLLHALEWAVNNIKFEFLLKCNDQSYITAKRMLMELPWQPESGLVWGYFSGNEPVTTEGVKTEPTWNLCSTYLPYAQGGGYVLSHDVVTMVTELAPHLDYLAHEDIALGVWLSPFKHINRIHDRKFNSGPASRGCHNSFLVSHPENILSMTQKYKAVKEKNVICREETELIATYLYNWTVKVNDCCNRTVPMIIH